MKDAARVLAVIPARGGSKSIPRKNIKLFDGHPLLAYSIAAAEQAASVMRTVVSTDSLEIADVARHYGLDVPFLRPDALAGDRVRDFPVFEHVLDWLQEHEGYAPDLVVQLRPTSPLRPPACVDDAVALLRRDPKADSVRGVVVPGQHPYKMWQMGEDGYLVPLLAEASKSANVPRQELPTPYWHSGHIDVMRHATIRQQRSLTGERILPLHIGESYSVDIDSIEDWERAEWIFRHRDQPRVRPTVPWRS